MFSVPTKAAVRLRRVPAPTSLRRALLPRLAVRPLQLLSKRPDEGHSGGALRQRPRPAGTRAQLPPAPPTPLEPLHRNVQLPQEDKAAQARR